MKNWLCVSPDERIIEVSTNGPIASLAQARDLLRNLPPEERRARPVRVLVQAGTYFLNEPFGLELQDSGTPECPVIYAAVPGVRPRISGGRSIRNWQPGEVRGQAAWVADLPAVKAGTWFFTQLFVNGERRLRTRLPKTGFYRIRDASLAAKESRAGFFPGELKAWHNLADVKAVVLQYWVESHLGLTGVDEAANLATFTTMPLMFNSWQDEIKKDLARYYVENVFEAMDSPGDWYLDRLAGRLYYLPRPGETPENTEIIAPVLDHLLALTGESADNSVHDVHFVGLAFAHSEWSYAKDFPGSNQAAFQVPAAVRYLNARDCSFRLNTVQDVATYAVESGPGCRGITVIGNRLEQLGAGGIKVCPGSSGTWISDNLIRHGGRIFHSAVGIWIGDSSDNTVEHNEIFDFYYTGISIGWVWGYGPSKAWRNLIRSNYIHKIGQGLLSDMGGIYSLGISPGTQICHNVIHDVRCYGYGASGLYPDEGTSFVLYENNVTWDVDSSSLHMNYGRDIIVRNNIFAYARDNQIRWGSPKKYRPMTFERNLVIWDEGSLVFGNWHDGLPQIRFDRNLYWQTRGQAPDFSGADWNGWRRRGWDCGSLLADPLVADAANHNFALRSDSPAFRLGFKPIDLSQVGPRPAVLLAGQAPAVNRKPGPFVWTRLAVVAPDGATEITGNPCDPASVPVPERTPCRVKLRAVFHNAGDQPFSAPVSIMARTKSGAGGKRLQRQLLEVPPGREVAWDLEVAIKADMREILIDAEAKAKNFWGSSLSLGFRPVVKVPRLPPDLAITAVRDALRKQATELPVSKGDVRLGSLWVGVAGDRLALAVAANASPIRLTNPVYNGACLDLFAKNPDSGTKFGQIFLLPGDGKTAPCCLHTDIRPVTGADIHFELTPEGYEIELLVPLSVLDIALVKGEFGFKMGIYTWLKGQAGILRANCFNERSITDLGAYGRMMVDA